MHDLKYHLVWIAKYRKQVLLRLPTPPSLARGAIDRLMAYPWPGNVRELENLVERALILSKGDPLTFDNLAGDKAGAGQPMPFEPQRPFLKLDDLVSGHIRRALETTNGKIHGKRGAAELLGINASTLRSRTIQLRIPYGRKSARKETG